LIAKTLQLALSEICTVLLFSDEINTNKSLVPPSINNDMRSPQKNNNMKSSEMFSSCLSAAYFEQSMISPGTASVLSIAPS
jgi:hypothetical protein